MTCDLAVHGWDLAQAVGVRKRPGGESADAPYARVAPKARVLRDAGEFGPPVPVPEDAPPRDRLLGLLGRRPYPAARSVSRPPPSRTHSRTRSHIAAAVPSPPPFTRR